VFFEFIRALASILAAAAALLGLYFGVTRAARLRRREQLFRESLTALTEHDPRRPIVSELHRAALADLIARQMTGSWRTTWPWFAWLVITALYGQVGYAGAGYLARDVPWSLNDFLIATTGDGYATGILMLSAFFGLFPVIFRSYIWTLSERAKIAQRFYAGESIARPTVLVELEFAAEMKARMLKDAGEKETDEGSSGFWRPYAWSLVPGLFCASLGLLVGLQIWIERQPGDRLETLDSVGGFLILPIFLFAFAVWPTASVWQQVVRDLRKLAPGGTHPGDPSRVRNQLGRRASQHGVAPAPRRVAGPVNRQVAQAARRSRRIASRYPGRGRLRWPSRLRWRRPGRR
jgi:hypothetical protein